MSDSSLRAVLGRLRSFYRHNDNNQKEQALALMAFAAFFMVRVVDTVDEIEPGRRSAAVLYVLFAGIFVYALIILLHAFCALGAASPQPASEPASDKFRYHRRMAMLFAGVIISFFAMMVPASLWFASEKSGIMERASRKAAQSPPPIGSMNPPVVGPP